MSILYSVMSIGLPFVLLFGRKRKWYTDDLKLGLIVCFSLIGIIGLFCSLTNQFRLLSYSFIVTPIFIIFDLVFRSLSIKKNHRDFNLWLNFSDDIDGVFAPMRKHRKFKKLDIIFSISLLLLIVLLAVLGILFFGKSP